MGLRWMTSGCPTKANHQLIPLPVQILSCVYDFLYLGTGRDGRDTRTGGFGGKKNGLRFSEGVHILRPCSGQCICLAETPERRLFPVPWLITALKSPIDSSIPLHFQLLPRGVFFYFTLDGKAFFKHDTEMLSDARFGNIEIKMLILLAKKININVIHTLLLLLLDRVP